MGMFLLASQVPTQAIIGTGKGVVKPVELGSSELDLMEKADEGTGETHEEKKSHHSNGVKSDLTSRLNQIEGQIQDVRRLIENNIYCDDVLTEIAAVQSALNSVSRILLEGHMKSCVVERICAGEDEVIDELMITVRRMMKK
ncbi:DNA-binding FrmR family transcriptional regulator [Kroppenstedtia sanguinis]